MHTPTNRQGKSSLGRHMSLPVKAMPNTGKGVNDAMLPKETSLTKGKAMRIANGQKDWNLGRGPMRGNMNDTSNKVQELASHKARMQAISTEVGNMYDTKPMNLVMNRNASVKRGKPAKHEHNDLPMTI